MRRMHRPRCIFSFLFQAARAARGVIPLMRASIMKSRADLGLGTNGQDSSNLSSCLSGLLWVIRISCESPKLRGSRSILRASLGPEATAAETAREWLRSTQRLGCAKQLKPLHLGCQLQIL